jgi:transposase
MQGTEMPERSARTPVYVGIDVCKDWLDVYLHPVGHNIRVLNSRVGLSRLKRELTPHRIDLIVMEATGKYHRQAHRILDAAGFAVAIVNPLRARLFAEATGALAKTDALDARLLAVLAEGVKPPARPPTAQALEALQELLGARQAATAEATALSNRRGASQDAFVRRELARRARSVQTHIARLDAEIARRIESDAALRRRFTILLSIPGVGRVTAAALVAGLAELGSCSGKAASLLAGLAPLARDSGETNGQRHIRGGRAPVRRALYMAAVTAARCNPDLAAFYRRLRKAGKKPKVALTAVMRKLVVLANTLIHQDRPWQPKPPIHA